MSDCYWSAEYGAARAKGRYLCFPLRRLRYPPEWAIRMLQVAVESQADLIYNEFVLMGPESAGGSGVYQRWRPTPRRLVKSQFLIRAAVFPGFSGKPKASVSASADQVIGQELLRAGRTFACARVDRGGAPFTTEEMMIKTWQDIPGFFDFQDIYDQAVDEAKDGDTLIEVGAFLGKSAAYMAEQIKLSGKDLRLFVVDSWDENGLREVVDAPRQRSAKSVAEAGTARHAVDGGLRVLHGSRRGARPRRGARLTALWQCRP